MCIDIVELWFGTADEQIQSIFDSYLAATHLILFQDNKLSKYQWMFTKLDMCTAIVEILFLILMGKFHQFLTVICPRQDNAGVLSFHIFTYIFFAQKLQLNSIILQTIKYQ